MSATGHDEALPEHLDASDSYWEEEALPALSDYVRIPCVSPEYDSSWESNGHIVRAAELLRDWAQARPIEDMHVDLVQLPGLTPVILADVAPAESDGKGGRQPPTVLYGHLDKQPPLGAWREGLGPFEPVREDDRLYGRGTADDGYSLFAALGAVEIAQRSGQGHGRCVAIIEASEESGSVHLAPYLDLLADRLDGAVPGLVVGLDSGAATYDTLWSTSSLRGIVTATVSVAVLSEGVHSGGGGGLVPDSFRILRALLSRVEDETTGEVLLPSAAANVPPGRLEEARSLAAELGRAAVGEMPLLPGMSLLGNGDTVDQVLARTWKPSLAYVGLDGMPAIEDAGNVLRPSTSLKIALRVPPRADAAEVGAELVGCLTKDPPYGASVEVADVVTGSGFDAPETAAWLAQATDEASLAYFGAPARTRGEGGTIPFLSMLLERYETAQFFVTGVLGPGSNAHGTDEMLHIPTAKRLTAALAHVLTRVPPGQ